MGTQGVRERAVEAAVRDYLARRFRRFGPGIVLAGVLALVLALVPPGGSGRGRLAGAGSSGTGQTGGGTGATGAAGGPGAGGDTTSGGGGGAGGAAGLGGGSGISAAAAPGWAGTAVSGVHCGPGVRQVPWSAYAPWCEPAYHGSNGGATAPGVTGSTITLTYRIADSGESKAVFAAAGQAGNATDQQYVQDMQTYVGLLNRRYELYGRRVVLKPYHGQGDWLQEDQGQDLAGAQADAATARDLGSFADVSVYSALGSSISDRLLCMHLGGVIASGAPGAVLSDPGVISSYLGDSPESIARSGGAASGPARRSGPGQRRPGRPLVPTTSSGGWPGI